MGGGRRRRARLRLSVSAIGHAMSLSLPIVNLTEARFECTYGRGCDGVCCQSGRPLIYPEEIAKLDANLEKFLPLLRPEARACVEKKGYLTDRRRLGVGLEFLRLRQRWLARYLRGERFLGRRARGRCLTAVLAPGPGADSPRE